MDPQCAGCVALGHVHPVGGSEVHGRSEAAGGAGPPSGLADLGLTRVLARNPGPYTLSGTNTWVVGRDPAWVVDPGPLLEDHVEAVLATVEGRGGLGGIALTHDHADHVEAVEALREHAGGAPVAAARNAEIRLADGAVFGPLTAVATPGHAPDHLAFLLPGHRVCFTGDAVLGEGSVFIADHPGAMSGYLRALARLRGMGLRVLCPGHGPPIWDPASRLEEYVDHRLDRERRLLEALGRGLRSHDALLDDVWSDAPAPVRPAAAVTLRAHLDKLAEDGRLPPGLRR
jgi:glyoxylase-like metal-dependent hydrolase (beta-lactamase superfamily II)